MTFPFLIKFFFFPLFFHILISSFLSTKSQEWKGRLFKFSIEIWIFLHFCWWTLSVFRFEFAKTSFHFFFSISLWFCVSNKKRSQLKSTRQHIGLYVIVHCKRFYFFFHLFLFCLVFFQFSFSLERRAFVNATNLFCKRKLTGQAAPL